jgi:hypothetical protein
MAWYVIYINASNERGEYNRQDNLYLKDPDFCRGADKPFQTYQKTGGKDAFLPWMTKLRQTPKLTCGSAGIYN